MTLKRASYFENSIGRFDYTQCTIDYYAIGIRQINEKDYAFLIATTEKALCDLIAYTPKLSPRFISSMREFLEEDLKIKLKAIPLKGSPEIQVVAIYKKENIDENLLDFLNIAKQSLSDL